MLYAIRRGHSPRGLTDLNLNLGFTSYKSHILG